MLYGLSSKTRVGLGSLIFPYGTPSSGTRHTIENTPVNNGEDWTEVGVVW
jgi:hypothetical protein